MAAAVGAFLMLSTMSLLAKLLTANHNVVEVAFWRNLIGVLPFLSQSSCSDAAKFCR